MQRYEMKQQRNAETTKGEKERERVRERNKEKEKERKQKEYPKRRAK